MRRPIADHAGGRCCARPNPGFEPMAVAPNVSIKIDVNLSLHTIAF